MLPFVKRGIAENKLGKSPGTIAHVIESVSKDTSFEIFEYSPESLKERRSTSIPDLTNLKKSDETTWISIFGLAELDKLHQIKELANIHSLTLEDILNPGHRPKVEFFEDYVFVVMKMLSLSENGDVQSEQVSFVFGDNFVLTFEEKAGDIFDSVRDRIRSGKGRIRGEQADYLLFALIDIIVDNYFVILESLALELEEYELQLLQMDSEFDIKSVHETKMNLFYQRKLAWPLREISNGLLRSETNLIRPSTKVFFQDIYDHSVQIIETTETLRDVVLGITDLYMSTVSNRTNEIMQTLTIIATIFIPLTFIAGVYGMNFEYMPELKWEWGYPAVWVLMIVSALLMLGYFKRKKWF